MWIVTKEALAGIVRTFMPYVWAWLLSVVGGIDWLADLLPSVPPEGLILIVGTVLYAGIRWAAEKWGWIGYFLVINQKPEYPALAQPTVGAHEASSELPPI